MISTEIYDLLASKIPNENILKNEPMKKHTSFKIGGNAEMFIKAKDIKEIREVLQIAKDNNIPLTVIGNGSNILVKDNGIEGIVLKVEIDGIEIENTDDGCAIVSVGAGVLLGKLAQILLKKSISGFEFASGIPGTIGGGYRTGSMNE